MTEINKHDIINELSIVGNDLKRQFLEIEPVIESDEMMSVFHRIDGQASESIRIALQKLYPNIGWLEGELDGADVWELVNSGRYWICDAIDGAVQFVRGIPQWCISLTLIENGKTVFTAIVDVMHSESFYAMAGHGAYLNDRSIQVNNRASHISGIVASSQPPFINDNKKIIRQSGDSLTAVLSEAGAVRNLGPTSLQLAYVASGRLDAFWEYGEDTFNCLGGALLVNEAGGKVSDIKGNEYGLNSDSFIAAPPQVHSSLMAVLRDI